MIRVRPASWQAWLPWAAAAALATWTWITLWFHEYEPDLDALGLFNPAYMQMKTGHLTYPIYAYPTEMVIHPPTHYWILAHILELTGLTVQGGALLPVIIWVAVAAVVIASSAWRPTVKIGLLFAVWLGIVVWPLPNFVRPDIAVAASWVVGLVALETARIGGWRLWRLALGSFAIALASTLHYPASLAVVGVVPYLVLVARDLSGRSRVRALVALVVPGAVVLLVYLAVFVRPHYADIKYVTSHQNAQGHGFFAALDQTRQAYELFARNQFGGPLITHLMWPLLHWGIPAAFVGPAVLLLFRETRVLALAAIPYLFTLVFYAREKTIYYYAPDVFIYFAALGVVVARALDAIAARWRVPVLATTAAAFVAAVVAGALAQPALSRFGTFTWHPRHADMEVARAAGTKLVPAATPVLTNDLALWYVTGANTVYYPRDFDESLDLSGLNLRRYLAQFTVVEESYDSWTTGNTQHLDLTDFLLDGRLKLNGFYFGRSWTRDNPTAVRYLVMTTRRQPIRGYAWDGKTISQFAEAPHGSWALVGAYCPSASTTVPGTEWQTGLYLPGAVDNTLTIERAVRVGLVPPGTLQTTWSALTGAGCRRAFEFRLNRVGTTPVGSFLSSWRHSPRAHTVMRFPQAEPEATNLLYAPATPTRVVHTVDLTKASGFGSTPAQHVGTQLLVRAPGTRFTSLFQTNLPDPGTPDAWIQVRLHVVKGLVAICSQDTQQSGCLGRINIGAGPPQTLYLRAGRAHAHLGLYMDNRGSAASVVDIESIRVLVPR